MVYRCGGAKFYLSYIYIFILLKLTIPCNENHFCVLNKKSLFYKEFNMQRYDCIINIVFNILSKYSKLCTRKVV